MWVIEGKEDRESTVGQFAKGDRNKEGINLRKIGGATGHVSVR
jgi:hypothetical protein